MTEEMSIANAPVFRSGNLVIVAEAMPVDIRPADFETGLYSTPAVMESWRNRTWQFCETQVSVRWADVVIGTARGGAEPHGSVAGEYVDSLSREARKGEPAPVLRVVRNAVGDARVWVATLGNPIALAEALNKAYRMCDDYSG